MSEGCKEDDRWRGSHSVTIVSNTGCGLACSGTGTVQLRDYAQVRGLQWIAQDNTLGPLNTRSLTDVRRRARELTPPARKGIFLAENKPNNKHHKLYRQFAKPPGQAPGEFSSNYPRATSVEGDDKRYAGLVTPVSDSLFAAYDPLDMEAAKYLIVASSDYLYTPRSLFWPDKIFLKALKLDWRQSAGMMISVRRVVNMEPQVIVVATRLITYRAEGCCLA